MAIFEKRKYGSRTDYYLFGRHIGHKIDRCLHLGDWYAGWRDLNFFLTYRTAGYEDGNGRLNISMLGWHSVFILPFRSRMFPYGDCDAPEWGVAVHGGMLWVYLGGTGNMGRNRYLTWDLPFVTWIHMRRSIECAGDDGSPVMTDIRDIGGDGDPLMDGKVNRHVSEFTDRYDGSVTRITYWAEEREWRRKWLTWTGKHALVRRYIEVVSDDEVGSGKTGWKGGAVGWSYDMLPGETAPDCAERMKNDSKLKF